jgi:acetyltransferase
MDADKVNHLYPGEYEAWVSLADGSHIFLRPIKPTDGPLILDSFQKLSKETVYFRFLTNAVRLEPRTLKRLVEIDYQSHFALAAIVFEEEAEAMIGICRYMAKEKPGLAELAVVLRDDWQGRGLGRVMVTRVVDIARSKGISSMEIHLDHRNEGMKRIFTSLGYPVQYESSILGLADRMEIYLKEITI